MLTIKKNWKTTYQHRKLSLQIVFTIYLIYLKYIFFLINNLNNCKSKLLFKFCFSVWNQAYINLSKLHVTSTRIYMHFYHRESCKYMYDYHWFTLVKTGCHLFLKTCKTPSWHQLTPSLPQRRGSTIVKRWWSRINSKERIYNKFKGDDLQ